MSTTWIILLAFGCYMAGLLFGLLVATMLAAAHRADDIEDGGDAWDNYEIADPPPGRVHFLRPRKRDDVA